MRNRFLLVAAALAHACAPRHSAAITLPIERHPGWNLTLPPWCSFDFGRAGYCTSAFGQSRACLQLRRKNRLRRLGVSGQRI